MEITCLLQQDEIPMKYITATATNKNNRGNNDDENNYNHRRSIVKDVAWFNKCCTTLQHTFPTSNTIIHAQGTLCSCLGPHSKTVTYTQWKWWQAHLRICLNYTIMKCIVSTPDEKQQKLHNFKQMEIKEVIRIIGVCWTLILRIVHVYAFPWNYMSFLY